MKDCKIRVKAEEYKMLTTAFPRLREEYGMKMGVNKNTAIEWKYCCRCGYYFTENLEKLYRCPLCGRILRYINRAPKKTIDPEKILGGE